MTERKTFIRKIKQGDKIRYTEVWNERQGKKVIQHHVRYLGSDPDNLPDPSSFDLETIHFEKLAFIWCFREKERGVRNLWPKINRTSPLAYWDETS